MVQLKKILFVHGKCCRWLVELDCGFEWMYAIENVKRNERVKQRKWKDCICNSEFYRVLDKSVNSMTVANELREFHLLYSRFYAASLHSYDYMHVIHTVNVRVWLLSVLFTSEGFRHQLCAQHSPISFLLLPQFHDHWFSQFDYKSSLNSEKN